MEKLRYRPHHIFCKRFLKVSFAHRGEVYNRESQKVQDIFDNEPDAVVEIVEGVDQLCQFCQDCRNERCQNPKGDEEAVRKWDGIIVKGLGVGYGESKSCSEWLALVREKPPLNFCQTKCPWKLNCAASDLP
ncbi:MAG: DUF1284 domain-containing protein [Syntrophales bacterium LBB04]|nr:DUF1284 domain-containing protein [Syntrophales bacterium LBB04]